MIEKLQTIIIRLPDVVIPATAVSPGSSYTFYNINTYYLSLSLPPHT